MSAASRHGLSLVDERRGFHSGLALFNAGEFFEAHDAWEEIWSQVQDRRRERFYRGLIRAAVTLELLRRGRAVGVRQVFVSCLEEWEGLPDGFMGLDRPAFVARLRHAIEPAITDLETRHVQIDPGRLFAIELLYDPFESPRNGEGTAGASG
ncbi:MAG: DUF309 domain-containing protein [Phycisphaerae bacterium]